MGQGKEGGRMVTGDWNGSRRSGWWEQMGGETFFQWSPPGYLGNGDEIRSLTPSTFVRKKASAVSRRGGGVYTLCMEQRRRS